MPQPLMPKQLKSNSSTKTYKTFKKLTPKEDILFIIEDWNEKVERHEIPVPGSSLSRIQGYPQDDGLGNKDSKVESRA